MPCTAFRAELMAVDAVSSFRPRVLLTSATMALVSFAAAFHRASTAWYSESIGPEVSHRLANIGLTLADQRLQLRRECLDITLNLGGNVCIESDSVNSHDLAEPAPAPTPFP